jgi:hypothetical protein
MSLSVAKKLKIEEEEKYRNAVAASITESSQDANQKHGIPLVLSVFIPGLGQIVKGQMKKGLIIFFAPSIAFLLLFLFNFIGRDGSNVIALLGKFWLAGIVLYVWQLYDAYNK